MKFSSDRHCKAFSLVEVALALGVASIALISVLGLMPVGLSIFHDSIHATVQANVLRELSSQIEQTPFDQISGSSGSVYFSDQATRLPSSEGALLEVSWIVEPSTELLKDAELTYASSNLKTVQFSFFTQSDRAKQPKVPSSKKVIFVAPGAN